MATTTAVISGRWTPVYTLGRGASGVVVSLAADDASGALFAVKSAPAGPAAEHLRREGSILSALRSPHVVPCLGVHAAPDGGCQLLLEFAPGGSLADVAARWSGGGDERAVAAYAADVARGLAYAALPSLQRAASASSRSANSAASVGAAATDSASAGMAAANRNNSGAADNRNTTQ